MFKIDLSTLKPVRSPPEQKNSGLLEAAVALQDIDDLAFVELDEADGVRHPLVQKIIRAYRRHRV